MKREQRISSSSHKGMSLLECLTTIALVIIILSAAAPSFYQWFQRQHVVSQTRAVGQMLSIASKQAVQTGEPVYVSAVAGKNWCIRLSHSARCDCHSGRHCKPLPDNYLLVADSANSYLTAGRHTTPLAKFEATQGMSMGFANTLSIYAGGFESKVILSNLGRVRFCMTPPAGGLPACS
ncbi:Tfp pilus assembly protein FimT/FimU [Alteromonas sp. H39]|uniref:Tfp pilus assembly protein FimT/FimU n=1 Tax=Alteromonas sp. H39 TaxID=3389876 RepID=UPI0039E1E0EC